MVEILTPKGVGIEEVFGVPHLGTGFQPITIQLQTSVHVLPYEQLGGQGLERLCYLLLLGQGPPPRYFANPGQRDRAIDLIMFETEGWTVYQCKNTSSFGVAKMAKALRKFEVEYLCPGDLPKPSRFVLCCPSELRELRNNMAWTTLEHDFQKRNDVRIEYWDRTYLDETLKRRPDIVAELFSNYAAEQYCELPDWNSDLFLPVAENSREPSLKRYFVRRAADRIHLDPEQFESFTEKLERNGSILIKGLPGSGKTMTSLAMAVELGRYRVFYVSLRQSISNDDLVAGIKRRLSRPTIFVLDDCQGKFEQVGNLLIRLDTILQERSTGLGLIVFLTRSTPTAQGIVRGEAADDVEFEENMALADALLELDVDRQTFAGIINRTNPALEGLSKKRLDRTLALTGRDLHLLDILLETIGDPADLDVVGAEQLFQTTLRIYFGFRTVHRPSFMRLAALAQFDVAPPVEGFPADLRSEDDRAFSELVAVADRPPRYFFLHSSIAELIFRALAANAKKDYVAKIAEYVTDFLRSRSVEDEQLPSDLSSLIGNRLKLDETDDVQNRLKSLLLQSEEALSLIEGSFERLPLDLLANCLILLKSSDSSALERYVDLVRRRIEDGTVLDKLTREPSGSSRKFLWIIKAAYPALASLLREQLDGHGLHWLVRITEFPNFLSLLSNLAGEQSSEWQQALALLPETEITALIQRTIDSGRSIGALSPFLGALKRTDEALHREVEKTIGAGRVLDLIGNRGTVVELFKFIQHSSADMAGQLIEKLDDATVDRLILKTIASRRSIGTIHLTLRKLKQNNKGLLHKLEERIGASRLLHLISSNGTIFELFRSIEYSSAEMAGQLISRLDGEAVDRLISRTIAAGRSIGTLHFTTRELKQSDSALLGKLEEKIGASRLLHLIASNGTIFELFRSISDSSEEVTGQLIKQLDDVMVDRLIRKTIASGRSIGTLSFTLRELKQNNEALLGELEDKIGASRFVNLIARNGTLVELFGVIRRSTLEMARRMVGALDETMIEQLVLKTISTGRRVGSLHWTLSFLKRADRPSLSRLEEAIGSERWWAVICSNGSIRALTQILVAMDWKYQRKLMSDSTEVSNARWQELLLRGTFADMAYAAKEIPSYFGRKFNAVFLEHRPTIEALISNGTWEYLNNGYRVLIRGRDSAMSKTLLNWLEQGLKGTQPDTLEFSCFSEMTNCLHLLWRLFPAKREALTRALLTWLKPRRFFYDDETYIYGARFLFSTMADPQADSRAAALVRAIGNDEPAADPCADAPPLDVLFYLWNLYALWFEWKTVQEQSFAKFLHPEIAQAAGFVVEIDSRKGQREERDTLVALMGLLAFVSVKHCEPADLGHFRAELPRIEIMIERFIDMAFVHGVFFLFGLEWLYGRDQADVPQSVWRDLLPKAAEYTEKTAALENLRRLVQKRAGFRPSS